MRRFAAADLVCGGVLLGGVILLAVLGPLLWPVDPIAGSMLAMFKPPGVVAGGMLHPLGTDQIGRDLFARILFGTRLSLAIVLMAGLVGAVLGNRARPGCRLFRRRHRCGDHAAGGYPAGGAVHPAHFAGDGGGGAGDRQPCHRAGGDRLGDLCAHRPARAMELRELEYIEAARSLGASIPRILRAHMLPNLMAPQLVLLTLDLPRLVVLEASVGFLGLGVQPPTPHAWQPDRRWAVPIC